MSYAGPLPALNSVNALVQSAEQIIADPERARTDYTNVRASSHQQIHDLKNENSGLRQFNQWLLNDQATQAIEIARLEADCQQWRESDASRKQAVCTLAGALHCVRWEQASAEREMQDTLAAIKELFAVALDEAKEKQMAADLEIVQLEQDLQGNMKNLVGERSAKEKAVRDQANQKQVVDNLSGEVDSLEREVKRVRKAKKQLEKDTETKESHVQIQQDLLNDAECARAELETTIDNQAQQLANAEDRITGSKQRLRAARRGIVVAGVAAKLFNSMALHRGLQLSEREGELQELDAEHAH